MVSKSLEPYQSVIRTIRGSGYLLEVSSDGQ